MTAEPAATTMTVKMPANHDLWACCTKPRTLPPLASPNPPSSYAWEIPVKGDLRETDQAQVRASVGLRGGAGCGSLLPDVRPGDYPSQQACFVALTSRRDAKHGRPPRRALVAGTFLTLRFLTDAAPAEPAEKPRLLAEAPQVTCAGRTAAAHRQLRGMWLTTVSNRDWPSRPGLDEETIKAEYKGWLDLAQRMNHNAIFVHVRPSGDAFWPSRFAPWSQWLTGRTEGAPGWDPMAFMVAETHARNLEFHAWFNPTGPGQAGTVEGLPPQPPAAPAPDWAVTYPAGSNGPRSTTTPGIPQARRFVEDSMLELAEKYDIDGVHFDDFFYPYPSGGPGLRRRGSLRRPRGRASKADWRRQNVNLLIQEMHSRIKQLKPWVKFGVSPFGIWRNRSHRSAPARPPAGCRATTRSMPTPGYG